MEKKSCVWHSYVENVQSLLKEFLIPTTIAFFKKTAPRLSNEAWIAGGRERESECSEEEKEREQCFANWFGSVFKMVLKRGLENHT